MLVVKNQQRLIPNIRFWGNHTLCFSIVSVEMHFCSTHQRPATEAAPDPPAVSLNKLDKQK